MVEATPRKIVHRGWIDELFTDEDGTPKISARVKNVATGEEYFITFTYNEFTKRQKAPGEIYYSRSITWVIDTKYDKDYIYLRKKVFYWKRTKREEKQGRRRVRQFEHWFANSDEEYLTQTVKESNITK